MKCLFRQLAFERGVSLFYKMKKYNQDSSVRNRFQGWETEQTVSQIGSVHERRLLACLPVAFLFISVLKFVKQVVDVHRFH